MLSGLNVFSVHFEPPSYIYNCYRSTDRRSSSTSVLEYGAAALLADSGVGSGTGTSSNKINSTGTGTGTDCSSCRREGYIDTSISRRARAAALWDHKQDMREAKEDREIT